MPDPAAFKKAKAHALQFLSYRDRSKWELSQYLGKKEHSPPVIQKTLDYLTEINYVDDHRFALRWGQYKINKNKLGKNRLYFELLGKGVNKETIEAILNTLYEENPEMELAAQCARKKWITLKSFEEKKKKRLLVQYLKRKGFSSDIIYQSLMTLAKPSDIENY